MFDKKVIWLGSLFLVLVIGGYFVYRTTSTNADRGPTSVEDKLSSKQKPKVYLNLMRCWEKSYKPEKCHKVSSEIFKKSMYFFATIKNTFPQYTFEVVGTEITSNKLSLAKKNDQKICNSNMSNFCFYTSTKKEVACCLEKDFTHSTNVKLPAHVVENKELIPRNYKQ